MALRADVAVLGHVELSGHHPAPDGHQGSRTEGQSADPAKPAFASEQGDLTSDANSVVKSSDTDPTPSIQTLPALADGQLSLAAAQRHTTPHTNLPFRAWSGRYVRGVAGFDTMVGLLAVLLAGQLSVAMPLGVSPSVGWMIAGAAGWPLAVALVRGYERSRVGIGGDEMRALLCAAVLVITVAAVPAGLFVWQRMLTAVILTAPIAVLLSLVVRFGSRKRLHAKQRKGHSVRRVAVVGNAAAVANLCTILRQEKHCGMQVVGVFVPSTDFFSAQQLGLTVLGDLTEVPAVICALDCEAVAVASADTTSHSFLRELSWSLEGTEIELLVHPGLIEVAGPRMHIRPFVGLPLLYVEQPHFTGWRRLVKRTTDIVLAGAGLVVISPILAVISVAIKLQDGGPVIFRQTRVGIKGRSFTMLKFRSMVVDAEHFKAALLAENEAAGPLFKIRRDPRITRLGRFLRDFSLDELPQLINVVSGSMSLVGPRPQLKSEVDLLESDARRRLLVTPGVTGLWQVSGRSDLGWEEAVRLDLRYVENWSLTMDLHILWKTFRAVATRHGSR